MANLILIKIFAIFIGCFTLFLIIRYEITNIKLDEDLKLTNTNKIHEEVSFQYLRLLKYIRNLIFSKFKINNFKN